MTPASAALLLPRRWRTVRLLALRTSALLCRHSCSSYSSHRGLQQMPLLITMWCPSAPTTGRTYQRGHRKDAAAPRRRRRRWPQLVWEHSRRGKRRRRLLRQLPLLQSAAAPSAAVMGSALPILRQQQRQQQQQQQRRLHRRAQQPDSQGIALGKQLDGRKATQWRWRLRERRPLSPDIWAVVPEKLGPGLQREQRWQPQWSPGGKRN
mmetsp:Transcript_6908/g.17143  ORF Transcript_6908/g.17143 Transcript_6908/m.17143 type:complete len:208 (-) Transcript_6908:214-837(-)